MTKHSNPDIVHALMRKGGVFHKETKTYKNGARRKSDKRSLSKFYR
jgi:hypothetical protein